jgi:hypothetical protein
MSSVTVHDDDDGFTRSSSRSSRGGYLKWSAESKWRDQDGCPPPSPMIGMQVDERLCRWQEGQPTYIVEKPLPNPDDLNAEIPQSDWEKDLNGAPRPRGNTKRFWVWSIPQAGKNLSTPQRRSGAISPSMN